MVELNISVRANDYDELPDILEHIVKEITDQEYRLREIESTRRVDGRWLCLKHGKYHWSRYDRA